MKRIAIVGSLCFAFLLLSMLGCKEKRQPTYEEGYVAVDKDVKLFYQKVGSGKQKIILPLGLYLFDGLKSLADSLDCTLLFYDVRNRGKSAHLTDSSLIGIWQDVNDLESIRKHFAFNKVSLVGWSYLGMMVMLYTTQHPGEVERIVQLGPVALKWNTTFPRQWTNTDPSPVDSVKSKQIEQMIAGGYHIKEPAKFTEIWHDAYLPELFGDTANVKKFRTQLLQTIQTENEFYGNFMWHFTHHFVGSIQHLNADSVGKEIKKINQPLLTIHGTKDRNAPYGAGREWVTNMSNARLVTIDGAGHLSWYENPGEVLHNISVFLKGNWPAKAEDLP